MNGFELQQIRQLAEWSVVYLANRIDVNPRTVQNWESDRDQQISKVYSNFIFRMFEMDPHFNLILQKITDQAFSIVYAEVVDIWLRVGNQLVLYPNTARQHFCDYSKRHSNDEIRKILDKSNSLTVLPMFDGRPINCIESDLKNMKVKRFHHSASNHLQDGVCHSLLKIPKMIISENYTKSVFVLSLENKLNEEKTDIMKTIDKNGVIFSDHDVKLLQQFLNETYVELETFFKIIESVSRDLI